MDMRDIVRANPLLAIMRKVPMEKTIAYAQAVFDGGIRLFEVALNSPEGLQQISLLRRHFGDDAMVGAGTATDATLARSALNAGAKFLLAPSAPIDVLRLCASDDVMFLPGVLTPSDVNLCMNYGFRTFKLFPAGDMPMSYVKSLKGPFDKTDYVAIGGVTPDNLHEFFKAGYIGAGMGSNLFPKEFMDTDQWDRATEFIAALVKKIKV